MIGSQEITFGLFDAITGIVTQPIRGAQEEGIIRFGKGIIKGLGGIVLKSGAAAFGIPGYTLKGLERQYEKRFSRGSKASILSVRIKQGIAEYGRASTEEKEEILKRWNELGVVV